MEDSGSGMKIKLDGSMGIGSPCYLTIITQDAVNGTKEVTYEIPYNIIDLDKLNQFLSICLITGYKITRVIPDELANRVVEL